ncbi:MAG: DUF3341 domain-containing protein [Myxococcales bacterium]|nr:DUF3341 domain-containing protein [Myxococcales bacterium]
MTDQDASLYGLVAEFETGGELLKATENARKAGYTRIDAYSPLPLHGMEEAIGQSYTRLPVVVFFGGMLGMIGGYSLQYYTAVIDYPIMIGGKGLHSWPAFIPVTFECTILFAAFAAVFGMILMNGLPRPHHPIFETPNFDRASQDRFFLAIEAEDPKFERAATRTFLEELNPHAVSEVTH